MSDKYEKMSRKELVANCRHCEVEQLQYEAENQTLRERVKELEEANEELWQQVSDKDKGLQQLSLKGIKAEATIKELAAALEFYGEGWHYRISEHESHPKDGVECTFETGEKANDALTKLRAELKAALEARDTEVRQLREALKVAVEALGKYEQPYSYDIPGELTDDDGNVIAKMPGKVVKNPDRPEIAREAIASILKILNGDGK